MDDAVLLVVGAALVAVVDWWSVHTGRRAVESVAKPVTMALLLAIAATVGDAPGDVRAWLVVGSLFGLVGDIALLGDGETRFMVGLGAFAIGHVAYVGAAIATEVQLVPAILGAGFVTALLAYRFVSRTLPGARAHGGPVLGGAVMFYAAVISSMVIAAWGTGVWAAAVGSALFAISDWVLGYRRFVGPLPGGRLSVMVPYHVGQGLLILALATA